QFKKVAGHAGVLPNERADLIATKFADGERILLYSGGPRDYERLLKDTVLNRKPKTKSSKERKGPGYSYVSMVGNLIEHHKAWKGGSILWHCRARYRRAKIWNTVCCRWFCRWESEKSSCFSSHG